MKKTQRCEGGDAQNDTMTFSAPRKGKRWRIAQRRQTVCRPDPPPQSRATHGSIAVSQIHPNLPHFPPTLNRRTALASIPSSGRSRPPYPFSKL